MEQNGELRRYRCLRIDPEFEQILEPGERFPFLTDRAIKAFEQDDVVLLWRSGDDAGLIGWSEFDSAPPVVVCRGLFDPPVARQTLAANRMFEGLTFLRNDDADVFRITTLEAAWLQPFELRLEGLDLPLPQINGPEEPYPASVLNDYRFGDLPQMILDALFTDSSSVLTSRSVFVALLAWPLEKRDGHEDTRQFLATRFEKEKQGLMDDPAQQKTTAVQLVEPTSLSADLVFALDRARRTAIRTTGRERIHLRHLVAGLLTDFPAPPTDSTDTEGDQALDIDLAAARADFHAYVQEHCPDDDAEGWASVLADNFADLGTGKGGFADGPVSLDTLLARVNADSTGGEDRLNITSEVEALASVMAASDVHPPFALGLFGDWGSGKTFFMEKMRDRVVEIGNTVTDAGENAETAYCRNVVQIWFNAWHFVEANLWASLVDHIFTELGTAVGVETAEQKRFNRLIGELGIAREKRCELQNRLLAIRRRRQRARRELADLTEEHRLTSIDHQDEVARKILAEQFKTTFWQGLRARINSTAANASGVAGLQDFAAAAGGVTDTAASVLDLLDKAGSTANRAAHLWRSLYAAPVPGWFWPAFFGVTFCLVPVAFWIATLAEVSHWLTTLAGFATEAVVVTGVVVKWASGKLSAASSVLDNIEAMRDQVMREVDAAEQARREQTEALEVRLRHLNDQIVAARAEARAVDREVTDPMADLKASPQKRLAEFIADRAESDDYRKHLGLLALIRQDFEKLSDLMVKQRQDQTFDENLPRIDRIVLYVDDLDRCPPERVVDVLEAIHLLLAFPLFMVVVGVDSRWVSRCLEKQYPELLRRSEADGNDSEAKKFAADTQDYLEKIFQLPYWLRRPEPSDAGTLIGDLVGPAERAGDGGSGDGGLPPVDPGGVLVPADDRVEDEQPGYVDRQRAERDKVEPVGPTEVQLQPAALTLSRAEADYMAALGGLVGRTPRSVKRFVNVYRVLKAADLRARRPEFATGDRPGFRAPLFLLAVVCGHPRAAKRFFAVLQEAGGTLSLEALKPDGSREASEPDQQAWQVFYDAVRDIVGKEWLDFDASNLRSWLPAVKRFDYRDWRHLGH